MDSKVRCIRAVSLCLAVTLMCDIVASQTFVFPEANHNTINVTRLMTPDDGCGYFIQPARVKTPIIYRSDRGFMPSVVQLGYLTPTRDDLESFCTATLITSMHVLTAATCIIDTLKVVRLGQFDRQQPNDGHIDRLVAGTTVHPQYTAEPNLRHNIAVVRMDQAVTFSADIWPICLPFAEPQRSKNYTGYHPFVVGWWTTQDGGQETTRLLDRQHRVLESCQRVAGTEESFVPTPGLICTENWRQEYGPCTEDGSPLIQPERMASEQGHRMFLTGIGSFGFECDFDDEQRKPLGYTRVQDYVDWIAKSL